jgi:hypothetical protein
MAYISYLDFGFVFRRSNANPIDDSSLWENLTDAQDYAAGRLLTKGAPYVGQIISVKENDGVHAYIIISGGALKRVGEDTENFATKDYVDNAISILPTKEYVDNAIASIEPPSLDGYATEEWVNEQGFITEIKNGEIELS